MKSLALLKPKSKASRVLGIDASTNSVAWCVFYNRRPVSWGEIQLSGKDIYDKIHDAKIKMAALSDTIAADYIVVESAVMVRSVAVAIKLAYVFGAILGELKRPGVEVITITPLQWQSFIGNKAFTKTEKAKLAEEYPGKSKAWYTQKIRELRKQKTMDFFNKKWPSMKITSDNVSDAAGLAYYGYYYLTERGNK